MDERELRFRIQFSGMSGGAISFLYFLRENGVQIGHFDYDSNYDRASVEIFSVCDKSLHSLVLERGDVLLFYTDGTIQINQLLGNTKEGDDA